MNGMKSMGVAVWLLCATATAAAQDTSELDRCLASGPAAMGQMGAMLQCAQSEFARQDKRLNANYQALTQRLDPTALAKLRAGQRAWITFRDAESASYLSDGRESALDAALAKARITGQRADELGARLNPGNP